MKETHVVEIRELVGDSNIVSVAFLLQLSSSLGYLK